MIPSMQGEDEEAEKLFQEALAGHEGIRDSVQAVYAEHKGRL
ncbi:hypothetical protein SAMN06265222_101367 [Neorhodopirellula lusitana]|uniref:Uncharacterized protein n=1 Tax=Neorhodopirellula lusitana TaxID=445327 RepID=A0ABY1PQ22_9BACT|nr:hypothetical protein [Neorhodopirellula lusitana]SMP39838.1 hypothetical protein SAMN06265222_101367 [Neorhodopirellula lusitana]